MSRFNLRTMRVVWQRCRSRASAWRGIWRSASVWRVSCCLSERRSTRTARRCTKRFRSSSSRRWRASSCHLEKCSLSVSLRHLLPSLLLEWSPWLWSFLLSGCPQRGPRRSSLITGSFMLSLLLHFWRILHFH